MLTCQYLTLNADIREVLAEYIDEHIYMRLFHIYTDIPAIYYRVINHVKMDECDVYIPNSYMDLINSITNNPDTYNIIYCGNRGKSKNGFKYIRNKLHGIMNIIVDCYENRKFICEIKMYYGNIIYHNSKEYYIEYNSDYYGLIVSDYSNNNIRAIYKNRDYIIYMNDNIRCIKITRNNYKYDYIKLDDYSAYLISMDLIINNIKYNMKISNDRIICNIYINKNKEFKIDISSDKINLLCDKSIYNEKRINYIGTEQILFDLDTFTIYRPCSKILKNLN